MKIQSTAIKETATGFRVELFLADDVKEGEQQQSGIGIVAQLAMEDRYPRLAELQKTALQNARNAIETEIQRLELAQRQGP